MLADFTFQLEPLLQTGIQNIHYQLFQRIGKMFGEIEFSVNDFLHFGLVVLIAEREILLTLQPAFMQYRTTPDDQMSTEFP